MLDVVKKEERKAFQFTFIFIFCIIAPIILNYLRKCMSSNEKKNRNCLDIFCPSRLFTMHPYKHTINLRVKFEQRIFIKVVLITSKILNYISEKAF